MSPLRLVTNLLLFAAASAAFAQEPYVAASAGESSWDLDCGPAACDRSGSTWRVAAGLRFNRVVALEAFLFDLGRARSSEPGIDGDWKARAAGAQALIGWQSGAFDLAGKIGLASVRTEFRAAPASLFAISETRTHTEPIAGVMFAYRFTNHLAARFDFDIVTASLGGGYFLTRGADVSTVSLGLAWRF